MASTKQPTAGPNSGLLFASSPQRCSSGPCGCVFPVSDDSQRRRTGRAALPGDTDGTCRFDVRSKGHFLLSCGCVACPEHFAAAALRLPGRDRAPRRRLDCPGCGGRIEHVRYGDVEPPPSGSSPLASSPRYDAPIRCEPRENAAPRPDLDPVRFQLGKTGEPALRGDHPLVVMSYAVTEDPHHLVIHNANEACDPVLVHTSVIENGLSRTEIVAFFEEHRYDKNVEELDEAKELRSSLSNSGRRGSDVNGSRMRHMWLDSERSGAPSRPNLKDSLSDSPKESFRGEFINQSCKTLSMMRILNDPNLNSDTERVLRELMEVERELMEVERELMEVERKRKKLEKQLENAGVTIAEDIPYEEARQKVQEIGTRMGEIGSSQAEHEDKLVQAKLREEYFRLEQDMEKYNNALMLTDEYIKEQGDKERDWEETNQETNLEALKKIRRHMPVEIKNTSEAQLCSQPTPNGKVLPKDIAKKFKRTDVLMLLRTNPNDIERVHPSTLENLRVTGLTLTERRAIHEHLREIGERWKKNKAEKLAGRKWTWFSTMRNNFKENLARYDRHVEKYGPPDDHPYATGEDPDDAGGCPLIGRQCPLRADGNPSYDDDYGHPDGAEYAESSVTKANAEDSGARAQREARELARAKKATARRDGLKKHYGGKILEVSKADGSCEAMDEALDRMESRQIGWIEARVTDGILGGNVDESGKRKETAEFIDALNELKLSALQFAEKSGMQLTGKKDVSADKGDNRSAIELGLSEEVHSASMDFIKGIEERMEQIKAVDGPMKSAIKQLRDLLEELHERSLNTLKNLGCEKPAVSRKWKSREDLLKAAKEKMAPEEEAAEEVVEDYAAPPAPPTGGRGGLLDEIAGRGRGGGGGRGNLLGAIVARGGRGRGRRDAGGRGDLLGAIAARGRGGGGRDASGRCDLLGAIAARGRGASGRADLLGAIAARGRGGGGRNAGARGGRGTGRADLLGAIAARGRGGGRGGSGRITRGGLMAEIAARGRAGRRGNGSQRNVVGGRGVQSGRSSRGGLMTKIKA